MENDNVATARIYI